jgi:hypothetical protein
MASEKSGNYDDEMMADWSKAVEKEQEMEVETITPTSAEHSFWFTKNGTECRCWHVNGEILARGIEPCDLDDLLRSLSHFIKEVDGWDYPLELLEFCYKYVAMLAEIQLEEKRRIQ